MVQLDYQSNRDPRTQTFGPLRHDGTPSDIRACFNPAYRASSWSISLRENRGGHIGLPALGQEMRRRLFLINADQLDNSLFPTPNDRIRRRQGAVGQSSAYKSCVSLRR
jgi:hypothetical protein